MSTMKKPAAATKRPAAQGSINETISKMAKGVNHLGIKPEGDEAEDSGDGENEGRDKAKGQKVHEDEEPAARTCGRPG